MARIRSRQPLLLAVTVSAVLHGLVFWGVLRREPPSRKPPVAQVLEMELLETVRPPPAPDTAPAPSPPPAVHETVEPRPERARSPQAVPSEAPTASPEAPASDAPREAAQSGAVVSDFPVQGTAPRSRLLPGPSVLPLPDAPSAPSRVGERLRALEAKAPDAALRELVAQHKVKRGSVHTYFYRLQQALLAAWRAKEALARRESGRTCEVEVRLVQAPSGRLQEATVLNPSCDPKMDAEVLADLRTAAESLPAPPPEVIAHRDAVRSIYRFALLTPPTLPPLEFDLVNVLDRKAIPAFNPRRITLVSAE